MRRGSKIDHMMIVKEEETGIGRGMRERSEKRFDKRRT